MGTRRKILAAAVVLLSLTFLFELYRTFGPQAVPPAPVPVPEGLPSLPGTEGPRGLEGMEPPGPGGEAGFFPHDFDPMEGPPGLLPALERARKLGQAGDKEGLLALERDLKDPDSYAIEIYRYEDRRRLADRLALVVHSMATGEPLQGPDLSPVDVISLDFVKHVILSDKPLRNYWVAMGECLGDLNAAALDKWWLPYGDTLIGKGDVVLDVGCGRGPQLPWLSEQVGEGGRVVGLDVLPDTVEFFEFLVAHPASRSFFQHSDRVEVLITSSERLDYPPELKGKVDLVLMDYVFQLIGGDPDSQPEHYETKVKPWLQSMTDSLAPDGKVLIINDNIAMPEAICRANLEAFGYRLVETRRPKDSKVPDTLMLFSR